jgi:hypothetical protein
VRGKWPVSRGSGCTSTIVAYGTNPDRR